MCRNETTNENLKGSYNKFGNPFDKGFKDNLMRLFRRDKRNWKPEMELAQVLRNDNNRGQVRKLTTARTLNRLSINSNGGQSLMSEEKNRETMFSGNKDT